MNTKIKALEQDLKIVQAEQDELRTKLRHLQDLWIEAGGNEPYMRNASILEQMGDLLAQIDVLGLEQREIEMAHIEAVQLFEEEQGLSHDSEKTRANWARSNGKPTI